MNRRNFLGHLGLATLAATAATITLDGANAQFRPGAGHGGAAGSWVLIGAQKVGFRVDRDVVRLPRGDNRFRGIKLRVRDNDIEMIDLKVVYGNGEVHDFPVRSFIRRGGETRTIDLRGGRPRRVYEVQMTYKSRPSFRGQATVEVWGLR